MPKIEKPRESGPLDQGKIGRLSGKQPTGGTLAIADETRRVGAQLEATGNAYFQAAKKSIQTSTYNDAIAKATTTFNERLNQRLEQKVDENGNPTYTTLSSDINKIAQEVQNEMSMKLLDPEVRNRFNNDYTNLATRAQLKGQQVARQQHLEFATAASSKAISTTMEAAKQGDPNDAVAGIAHLTDIVEADFEAGVYTRGQADKLIESGAREIKMSVAQKAIQQDPAGAAEFLRSQEAQALGLTTSDKLALQKVADNALADLKDKHNLLKKRTHSTIRKQQTQNAAIIEDKIKSGEMGEKEVEEAANATLDTSELASRVDTDIAKEITVAAPKVIDSNSAKKLVDKAKAKKQQDEEDAELESQVEEAKAKGVPLLERFTTRTIDKIYEKEVERATVVDEQGNLHRPSLSERVLLAKPLNTPVKQLQHEISYNAEHGHISNAEDLIAAYAGATDKPIILEGIKNDHLDALEYALDLNQAGGYSPEEALELARDTTYNKDEAAVKDRLTEFANIDKYKDENLDKTLVDIAGLEAFGSQDESFLAKAIPGVGFVQDAMSLLLGDDLDVKRVVARKSGMELEEDKISPILPEDRESFKRIAEATYTNTRSEKTVDKRLKTVISKKYAQSKLAENNALMYKPPEVTHPDISTETFNKHLQEELGDWLPEGKRAYIETDRYTDVLVNNPAAIASGINRRQTSYYVYYKDDDGKKIYKKDELGAPARWMPQIDRMINMEEGNPLDLPQDRASQIRRQDISMEAEKQQAVERDKILQAAEPARKMLRSIMKLINPGLGLLMEHTDLDIESKATKESRAKEEDSGL